jgi:hypothetical protein
VHRYASNPRRGEFLDISGAAIAILLAYGLGRAISASHLDLWYVDLPAPLGFYAVIRRIVDVYLWRTKAGQFIWRVPDLQGTYEAQIHSSQGTRSQGTLKIHQTFSKMKITLETPLSRSNSTTASLLVEEHGEIYLTYTYENSPFATAPTALQKHNGTCEFCFVSNPYSQADGDYYSGRNRTTYGSITLIPKERRAAGP